MPAQSISTAKPTQTNNFGTFLDSYSRQARLYPALLTLFPALLSGVAWFPDTLTADWTITLVTVAAACGVLYVLSVVIRSRGKKHEKRLRSLGGGWPTTIWLRHSSGKLQPQTLARYHEFIRQKSCITIPSAQDEQSNPQDSDLAYESAVKWLKEQCRGGTFPLVDKENAEYGFRRNMRGMKWIGVGISFFALAASTLVISLWAFFSPAFFAELLSISPAIYASMVINVIAILSWMMVVTDDWVLEAGDQYTCALLAVCDAPAGK